MLKSLQFQVETNSSNKYHTPLKRLVKQPLKAFGDLLGENVLLLTNQGKKYQQMSVEAGKSFLVTYHNPDHNDANQVSK